MSPTNLVKIILLSFLLAILSPVLQASDDADDNRLFEKLMQRLEHKKNLSSFSEADIILEQNFTDGDVEVVIFAKGGDIGMKRFWLFAPDGKLVYRFRTPEDNGNIGAREIVVESPEPADTSIVLDAYPEGSYTFVAKTFDNEWLLSQAELVHDIPVPVSITFPLADSELSRFDFDVFWESPGDAEKFIVELVNEETETELLVDVSSGNNSFRAPEEWIAPGVEYQVSVGVVNQFGNITFVEQTVYTAIE